MVVLLLQANRQEVPPGLALPIHHLSRNQLLQSRKARVLLRISLTFSSPLNRTSSQWPSQPPCSSLTSNNLRCNFSRLRSSHNHQRSIHSKRATRSSPNRLDLANHLHSGGRLDSLIILIHLDSSKYRNHSSRPQLVQGLAATLRSRSLTASNILASLAFLRMELLASLSSSSSRLRSRCNRCRQAGIHSANPR